MKWAAFIVYVLTAGGGLVLLSIWLARGGMRQREAGNRIRPPLIMSHFLLAATGLVIWIIYLAVGNSAVAWVTFGILCVVALVGFAMFGIWVRRRRARGAAAGAVSPDMPAEQHFPPAVVGLHGLLAATTLILVLLTAIGVGS